MVGGRNRDCPKSLEKSVLHNVLLEIPHNHLWASGVPALVPKSGFRNVKGRSKRGRANTGAEESLQRGVSKKNYSNSRFPDPGGAAQAARHILGPKETNKKKVFTNKT